MIYNFVSRVARLYLIYGAISLAAAAAVFIGYEGSVFLSSVSFPTSRAKPGDDTLEFVLFAAIALVLFFYWLARSVDHARPAVAAAFASIGVIGFFGVIGAAAFFGHANVHTLLLVTPLVGVAGGGFRKSLEDLIRFVIRTKQDRQRTRED